MAKALFTLNPAIDRAALAQQFVRDRRVQVRDLLTRETAQTVHDILATKTSYGFAYQGDGGSSVRLNPDELGQRSVAERAEIAASIQRAAAKGDYAVRFNSYPMLSAYQEKWAPDGPHDLLIEHLNADPFLNLMRDVTGIRELIKADAQATIFAPGDFLSIHSDSHMAEGWRVAYVLNFADPGWKPDWGGYLNFFDDDGDVVAGWRPRFNALNLFAVPQPHNVSYVPPFAPAGRFAITGWLRDR